MRLILILFITLFSVNIFSGVRLYQVKIKSFVNEKSISKAHLILRENETMGFTDKMGNHIEVTVSSLDEKITLNFKVSRDLEGDESEVIVSPEIVVQEKFPSEFSFENTDEEKVSVVSEIKRI